MEKEKNIIQTNTLKLSEKQLESKAKYLNFKVSILLKEIQEATDRIQKLTEQMVEFEPPTSTPQNSLNSVNAQPQIGSNSFGFRPLPISTLNNSTLPLSSSQSPSNMQSSPVAPMNSMLYSNQHSANENQQPSTSNAPLPTQSCVLYDLKVVKLG